MERSLIDTAIEACSACADACDRCAAACLREHDVKSMARCIALDIECAALCRLAAGTLARDSDFIVQVCQVCTAACEACGTECARHMMDHCQACADACRRCETACREVVSAQAAVA